MNKKFANRLEKYLESECSDFDLTFFWEWNEDLEACEAKISRDDYSKYILFKYDENRDDLLIELSEDSYYITREFDETVKYFWMLISPTLFPDNN